MSGVPEVATDSSLLFWGYNRGQDASQSQWQSWRMPSWSNTVTFPGGRNDPEILEAESDLTDDEFDRQYRAKFVERVGRVMKEWDDDYHLVDLKWNPAWPLYAALDYGYTNDWVWLWIQTDPLGENVYVIGEERFQLRDTEDIVRRDFKEATSIRKQAMLNKLVAIYAPPAEPDDTATVARVLKKAVRNNTGGDIRTRNALVRSGLKRRPHHLDDDDPEKKPNLFVDRSCTQLAWEMREGYRWPENRSEIRNDSENPLDKDNHGPEALGRFYKGHMERRTEARTARQGRVKMRSNRRAG